MNNLEELEKKYKELGKEIERLKKGKRWRAEIGEKYYYIDDAGDTRSTHESYKSDPTDFKLLDSYKYKTRNYFKTEEEAEEYLEKINTYYELMDLAEKLNGEEEIDWDNDGQRKYYISYVKENDSFYTCFVISNKNLGEIYCLDENFLEKAKERIGEERLIKLFK